MTWVALDHLVSRLKTRIRDLSHRQLLMVGLLGRDNWSIGGQREVDTWVGHQVGLELGQIDVQSAVEAKGGGDGGHYLAHQAVEVGVGGAFDVQVTSVTEMQKCVMMNVSKFKLNSKNLYE